MITQLAMSLLIRMSFESIKLGRILIKAAEELEKYHSDISYLVHIINQNNIELDEFDLIVLNKIQRRIDGED